MATVLLIEPDADSARTYAESLMRAGFRVEVPTTAADRQDFTPDVVVISVPRFERSLPPFAHGRSVPRIVLSSDASDVEHAAELDCAAVLIRPVMYDALVNEVRRVLRVADTEQPA
jgi:DNA-binding response OmpR family regulator